MRYFVVLRAIYLMAYYFVLSKRPSKSYVLSVTIASTSGSLLTFFIMFLVVFGSKDTKTRFPFESLLFHGLSYEEWRTAKVVKERMDRVQTITKGEENLPEDFYLVLLLILSFSGLIEHRPETPEERSDAIIGRFPREGEVLRAHTVDPTGQNLEIAETEHQVDRKEAVMFASFKQKHTDTIKNDHYRGTTLSRLVYDGVRIVFLRKKLGPKRPARTNAFMRAFGITTN